MKENENKAKGTSTFPGVLSISWKYSIPIRGRGMGCIIFLSSSVYNGKMDTSCFHSDFYKIWYGSMTSLKRHLEINKWKTQPKFFVSWFFSWKVFMLTKGSLPQRKQNFKIPLESFRLLLVFLVSVCTAISDTAATQCWDARLRLWSHGVLIPYLTHRPVSLLPLLWRWSLT